ncbi:MAG: maleylacetoacetate isomerase [Betaproteobacteria bacterium]|nr:maleylacetoacetate isomerase [Betaproteobacteria bacterium]MDE2423386.1 maleylacetoacetate isomerase [Betaproteobacteria bacterium]
MLKLYSYWRSSAAYRIRIALNLKELPYKIVPVPIVSKVKTPILHELEQLNVSNTVPVLVDEDIVLTQSLAIIEYLEERYPSPSLIFGNYQEKAIIRALSQEIVSDIHPLNNLRTLRFLLKKMNVTPEQKDEWVLHWLNLGLFNIEQKIKQNNLILKPFLFGTEISLFEVCLIPQVRNALASKLNLSDYPLIQSIYENAIKLPAFIDASWERQIDYQE